MDITLEQAKAFYAIATQGTIQKAGASLNKGHSAIMYLIKSLEEQTQLPLFDRSGYRNQITPQGEVVLRYCQQLLQTQNELEVVCKKLRNNYEPNLKLVYDGVIDFNIIADSLIKLNKSQVPTEITLHASYLDEVENTFNHEKADIMVTVVPIKDRNLVASHLRKIRMLLVAHKNHPLHQDQRKKISISQLDLHPFIKIKGAAPQLGLSTDPFSFRSVFAVNDFTIKKQALMKQLGFGWMPEYLIQSELKSHTLKVLKTDIEKDCWLTPKLYCHQESTLGKTAKQLLDWLKKN